MATYDIDSLDITKGSNTYKINADRIHPYATLDDFPATGIEKHLYITEDENIIYRWDGQEYVPISSAGGARFPFTVIDGKLNVIYYREVE